MREAVEMGMLQGLGASKGIAIGRAYVKPEGAGVVQRRIIQSAASELGRPERAK